MKALIATALLALIAAPAAAQNITAPPPPIPEGITVEEIKVHGASLVGNLEGNDVERQVMVVLPPSYETNPNKRYPVVYYLHGFAIDGKNFYNYMHVPEAVAHNAAEGNEFIVVVPSTLTRMGGSMYSSSVTTGDFRKFIAEDLVGYVDSHYRTIATRGGRGLVGHSMGGYGTWVIGMSYPQVFDSIWAQSACCVSPRTETVESATAMAAVPYRGRRPVGLRHARRPRLGGRLGAQPAEPAVLRRLPDQGRRGRSAGDRQVGQQLAAGDGRRATSARCGASTRSAPTSATRTGWCATTR